MGTKAKRKPGYGRLLDAWIPPEDAGDPIGCLATSFTFSPVFFEEECLSRFLRLESDPDDEDGRFYLIEREDKLRQVVCAAALVDQHHCQGSRSLRWDLLPARVKSGILHAKVSLLHWQSVTRLIVASANLTENGYRRNREVFGVLDFGPEKAEVPIQCLLDTTAFLRESLGLVDPAGRGRGPETDRCRELLKRVEKEAKSWQAPPETRSGTKVSVQPIFVGPKRGDVLSALKKAWQGGSPPDRAAVVSPFFDPPERRNQPAEGIWGILKKRGAAEVQYYVTAEDVPGESKVRLQAPESLLESSPKGRTALTTRFYRLTDEPERPLHMKGILLENSVHMSYLMGSSNFTSAGLGLGRRNLEAGLLYSVRNARAPKDAKALRKAFPTGRLVRINKRIIWDNPNDDQDDVTDGCFVPLPESFGRAVFSRTPDGRELLTLTLHGSPPQGFRLLTADQGETFLSEADWDKSGRPKIWEIPWPGPRPPSGFEVRWDKPVKVAWFPVNIENADSILPPEELRNLSLALLIEVLTTARPLHEAMRRWIRKRGGETGAETLIPELDPHKRVDTSTFLLRRTRRISRLLRGLRERMERPVATEQGLDARFNGPVGVKAVVTAIKREAQSSEEMDFLLAELALELSRATPREVPNSLPAKRVRRAIRSMNEWVFEQVTIAGRVKVKNLRDYVEHARKEVLG